jgi:hypothetical protein
MKELSDVDWLVLDLLMRAKQKGINRLSKTELLYNESIPSGVRVKLAWAAMVMDTSLISWHGQDFAITERGEKLFNAMFKKPTTMADVVIALPDRSGELAS